MLVTSVADSHSGLPVSSPMQRAISSARLFSVAAKVSSTLIRSSSGRRAQPGNAWRAACTADSTCSTVAPLPAHSTCWVTGLRDSNSSPWPASYLRYTANSLFRLPSSRQRNSAHLITHHQLQAFGGLRIDHQRACRQTGRSGRDAALLTLAVMNQERRGVVPWGADGQHQ